MHSILTHTSLRMQKETESISAKGIQKTWKAQTKPKLTSKSLKQVKSFAKVIRK